MSDSGDDQAPSLQCEVMAQAKKSMIRNPDGRPSELTGAWADLVEAAGGVQALCDRLDVHKTTLYRWIRGARALEGASATAVRLVAKTLNVKSPTE